MEFCGALKIPKGVTAVTGSGGKTTLLHTLADELPGRIILCTTTKMFPSDTYKTLYDPSADTVRGDWARVVCVGSPAENGKIGPCASLSIRELAELADYVLVEADGSKRLPLKAHTGWEPVIPAEAKRVICVVGASGFGQSVEKAGHRPELWRQKDTSPASVAAMLRLEGGWDAVLVNQCDTQERLAQARLLAAGLDGEVFAGRLQKGDLLCL